MNIHTVVSHTPFNSIILYVKRLHIICRWLNGLTWLSSRRPSATGSLCGTASVHLESCWDSQRACWMAAAAVNRSVTMLQHDSRIQCTELPNKVPRKDVYGDTAMHNQGSFPKNHSGNAECECQRRNDRGVGCGEGFCPSSEKFFDFGS